MVEILSVSRAAAIRLSAVADIRAEAAVILLAAAGDTRVGADSPSQLRAHREALDARSAFLAGVTESLWAA